MELLMCAASTALEMGLGNIKSPGAYSLFSVLSRVGFFALLRPTELLNLRARDARIFTSQDGMVAVWALGRSKPTILLVMCNLRCS